MYGRYGGGNSMFLYFIGLLWLDSLSREKEKKHLEAKSQQERDNKLATLESLGIVVTNRGTLLHRSGAPVTHQELEKLYLAAHKVTMSKIYNAELNQFLRGILSLGTIIAVIVILYAIL